MDLAKNIIVGSCKEYNRSLNRITLRGGGGRKIKCGSSTHFYRIGEEGGSGRPPPTVHLRTDDVTDNFMSKFSRNDSLMAP